MFLEEEARVAEADVGQDGTRAVDHDQTQAHQHQTDQQYVRTVALNGYHLKAAPLGVRTEKDAISPRGLQSTPGGIG